MSFMELMPLLLASIGLTIVLFFLGVTFFHETLTVKKVIGILLCICGVIALKG